MHNINEDKDHGLRGSTLISLQAKLAGAMVPGDGFDVVGDPVSPAWSLVEDLPPCRFTSSQSGLRVTPFVVINQVGNQTPQPIIPTVGGQSVGLTPAPEISVPDGSFGTLFLTFTDGTAQVVAAEDKADLPDDGSGHVPIGGYRLLDGSPVPIWSWDGNVHLSRVETMTFEVLFDLFSLAFISNEDTGSRTEYRNIDDGAVGLVTLSWDPDAGLWRLIFEGEPYTAERTITDPGGEYNYIGNTDPPPLDPLRLDPAN